MYLLFLPTDSVIVKRGQTSLTLIGGEFFGEKYFEINDRPSQGQTDIFIVKCKM